MKIWIRNEFVPNKYETDTMSRYPIPSQSLVISGFCLIYIVSVTIIREDAATMGLRIHDGVAIVIILIG